MENYTEKKKINIICVEKTMKIFYNFSFKSLLIHIENSEKKTKLFK